MAEGRSSPELLQESERGRHSTEKMQGKTSFWCSRDLPSVGFLTFLELAAKLFITELVLEVQSNFISALHFLMQTWI